MKKFIVGFVVVITLPIWMVPALFIGLCYLVGADVMETYNDLDFVKRRKQI